MDEAERKRRRDEYQAELLGLLAWDRPRSDLRAAVIAGSVEDVRRLLGQGADPNDGSDAYDGGGCLLAAMRSETAPAVVVALLEGGADPNDSDRNGNTPLLVAADNALMRAQDETNLAGQSVEPDWSMVRLLERHGAIRDDAFNAMVAAYGREVPPAFDEA